MMYKIIDIDFVVYVNCSRIIAAKLFCTFYTNIFYAIYFSVAILTIETRYPRQRVCVIFFMVYNITMFCDVLEYKKRYETCEM